MLYKCKFSNKGEVRALEVPCFEDLVVDLFGLPDHLTELPTTLQGSCSSTSTWTGLQVYNTRTRRIDLVLFLGRQLVVPAVASLGSCRTSRTRWPVPGRSRRNQADRLSGCCQLRFQSRPLLLVPWRSCKNICVFIFSILGFTWVWWGRSWDGEWAANGKPPIDGIGIWTTGSSEILQLLRSRHQTHAKTFWP